MNNIFFLRKVVIAGILFYTGILDGYSQEPPLHNPQPQVIERPFPSGQQGMQAPVVWQQSIEMLLKERAAYAQCQDIVRAKGQDVVLCLEQILIKTDSAQISEMSAYYLSLIAIYESSELSKGACTALKNVKKTHILFATLADECEKDPQHAGGIVQKNSLDQMVIEYIQGEMEGLITEVQRMRSQDSQMRHLRDTVKKDSDEVEKMAQALVLMEKQEMQLRKALDVFYGQAHGFRNMVKNARDTLVRLALQKEKKSIPSCVIETQEDVAKTTLEIYGSQLRETRRFIERNEHVLRLLQENKKLHLEKKEQLEATLEKKRDRLEEYDRLRAQIKKTLYDPIMHGIKILTYSRAEQAYTLLHTIASDSRFPKKMRVSAEQALGQNK